MSSTENGKFSFSQETFQKDFELLSQALEASNSGIILSDNQQLDNPIIFCNKAFEQITGYARSEVIGHNCRFLQKDDRDQESRMILRDAVKEGKSCSLEIRNYRKDGTLFWNELYMAPIVNSSGVITHFVGVQNDISRRKKAEMDLVRQKEEMENQILERTKSLKESEDYLSSIIQTVRESLIVLDPNLKVLSANDFFLKTFKVSYQETHGKILYELGNGQWNIPKLKELLENILPTSNPVEEFEVDYDFPHIGKKIMLLNAHRIELEGQFKDRILIAIEDITDRKEIDRRKDDFLSIASHELKTPLTTIKGYVQMLNRLMPENVSDKYRDMAKKTMLYIDRLNNLIAELLDVSRIQTGNIELHKDVFDFDKMVKEAVDNMQSITPTHNIILEGTSTNAYNGDESHLIQVINNLLSNAIKYSPNHKDIKVYRSLVSNYLKVSVVDQGVGINIDDQKKVFERFFRVSEVQHRFPGMGIGLYICDQIIKNHKGTLWVESEKDKGSTFSFTLPLTE